MSQQTLKIELGNLVMSSDFNKYLNSIKRSVKPKTQKMANRKTSRISKLGVLIALENQGCYTLVKRYDLN